MNTSKKYKNGFTILAIICLNVPLLLFTLWVYASELGHDQLERVSIFESYLPVFLRGHYVSTSYSLAFSFIGMLFCLINIKTDNSIWKILNLITLVACALFTLLNLFWLM